MRRRSGTPMEPLEHDIQKGFIELVTLHEVRYPALLLGHAIPNGGGRGKAQAGMLKAEGVRPGVWDWHLPVAGSSPDFDHPWHGLWIEFKSRTGRLRKEQREFGEAMYGRDHVCVVARDFETAWALTKDYLEGRINLPRIGW